MSKILSFVRLDFITVKPYFTLKNLAIMLLAPLMILIGTGASTTSAGMFMIFGSLYISYPFVICEKNGMDMLYPTLSITRGDVVLGRYLFALSFNLCVALIGLVSMYVTLNVTNKEVIIGETFLVLLAMFIVVSIVQSVQLPIYFKLGYEKAKLIAYMPFVGFLVAAMAINSLIAKGGLSEQFDGIIGWLAANPLIAAIMGVVIWIGIMVISCRTSMAYYKKRDF